MATQNTANELSRLIERLQRERKQHMEQIERIDETFKQFGIAPEEPSPRRGRKKGTRGAKRTTKKRTTKKKGARKKTGRRRRRTFSKTGEESVLAYVKQAGNPTTAQVNEHWTSEGRGGKADNALSNLVKKNKIKRENIKGERGSRYVAA